MCPGSLVHQAWPAGMKRGLQTDTAIIEELSQQLNETSNQLAYIRKILDNLVSGQILAVVTAASSTTSGPVPFSGSAAAFHQAKAASLQQPNAASGSVNHSASGKHIGSACTASGSCARLFQASWDLLEHAQTLAFQGHAYEAPMTHFSWPFIPSDPLPWFSLGLGAQSFHWASLRALTAGSYHCCLAAQGSPAHPPWTTPFTTELG